MQHALRISRKIEYGLRAMVCLASLGDEEVLSFREIARRMDVPETFLAKILKTLVSRKLVRSTRGAQGGYQLAKPAAAISFLDVIEAVEGPIVINLCSSEEHHDACRLSSACTMYGVWKLGQERMLEVYRSVSLDQIAMKGLRQDLSIPA
jgi:Rrf2 family protein